MSRSPSEHVTQVVVTEQDVVNSNKPLKRLSFFDEAGDPVILGGSGGSNTGTGTPDDPFVLESAKWFMLISTNPTVSQPNVTRDVGGDVVVITSNVDGNMASVLQPNQCRANFTMLDCRLNAGDDAIAAGPQVGDRVLWCDNYNYERQYIYTVTDVGGEESPFVLTATTEFPYIDANSHYVIHLEGTSVSAKSVPFENGPNEVAWAIGHSSSIVEGPGCIAFGAQSLVRGAYVASTHPNAVVTAAGMYQTVSENVVDVAPSFISVTEQSITGMSLVGMFSAGGQHLVGIDGGTVTMFAGDATVVGTQVHVSQGDANQITVAAGPGVELRSYAGLKTAGQHAVITIRYLGNDVYHVFGQTAV